MLSTSHNLETLYSVIEEEFHYGLSTPDKFLIKRWYMELRNNFLSGQYKPGLDEERKLTLDEIMIYYTLKMIGSFISLYFSPTLALQERIDYTAKINRFMAESYMEIHLKKKEKN